MVLAFSCFKAITVILVLYLLEFISFVFYGNDGFCVILKILW